MTAVSAAAAQSANLFEIIVNRDMDIRIATGGPLTWTVIAVLVVAVVFVLWQRRNWFQSLEIDEAEIGVGKSKIKLAPNAIDRQIAYKIWVELSTRKIGLPIDLDHDVVAEVYDSWHTFFAVTRELIKDVPVSKFRRKDTEKIVSLSIEVLNHGLRPHLTEWQARFRRWYESQSKRPDAENKSPQDIQKSFPDYGRLSADLLTVNGRLMVYRSKMYQIVVGTT